MNRRQRICFAMLLLFCVTVTGRVVAQLQPGIVVEEVTKDSAGEKAGLQPGDILLRWSRGDKKGEIQSPFDLFFIEVEQTPRGVVTLEGFRGIEKRTWLLGEDGLRFQQDIQARPNLPQKALPSYLEGLELAKADRLNEAVRRWDAAANEADCEHILWLKTWFQFRTAGLWAKKKQWREADAAYQKALQQAQGLPPEIDVQLLRDWGATYWKRGDRDNTKQYLQEALLKTQGLPADPLITARTLSSLCALAYQYNDLINAEEYSNQALTLQQRIAPGSSVLASTFSLMSIVAEASGNLTRAKQYGEQALAIWEQLDPGSRETAYGLDVLGRLALYRGDLVQAQEYFYRALVITEKHAHDVRMAEVLSDLGYVAMEHGDLQQAEKYSRRALAIREKGEPESLGVAMGLNFLAQVAWKQGDIAQAEKYCSHALRIVEKNSPDTIYSKNVFTMYGSVAEDRGDLVTAEKYLRKVVEFAERAGPDTVELANNLNNLGKVVWEERDLARAEGYFRRALSIGEKVAPESLYVAESLYHLGNVVRDRGDLVQAKVYYSHALTIWEKLAPGNLYHIQTLAALAALIRDMQQADEAVRLYEQTLNLLEGETARLGGSEEVRSGFRAKYIGYYKDYADLLISQNKFELAFQVLERSRARTLMETLASAHVDIRKGVEPALVEKERTLQQTFSAKSQARIQMLSHPHTEKEVADLDRQIKDILDQYHDVEGQIRSTSPSYAALTQPEPLGITQVQQQLLDSNTLLLEYSLGKKRSYVFAVTPDSLVAYELPGEAEIEGLARQVYNLLRTSSKVRKGETALQKQERLAKAELEYARASAKLSQMLLVPVASQLQSKRLLIVSDGALQYIPFSVLPDPASHSHSPLPLMARHEIVNLPSASVLAVLRRQEQERKSPSKAVAVLADPVFSWQDERVENTQMRAELKPKRTLLRAASQPKEDTLSDLPEDPLIRSVHDMGLLSLPRLPFTRREAESIMSVTPEGEGLKAVDFKASRELSLSSELANYRIVHFATHGLVDNQHPELSGLVLSLVDPQGKQQNGFLALEDIYNLNLPVDMVVLSACETGLGKQINGEGLIGLTRGFRYAGADRVVASLWSVDDVATADLMSQFYKGILQQGLSPAAALREAQIEMWKQKRWRNPYYWGAFELQGEWKPQSGQGQN